MTGPISLRPAVPTDAEFLAWALNEASGQFFRVLLGKRFMRPLAKVIAQPTHDFSYQHFVIAERDGLGVGTCMGHPFGTPSGVGDLARAAGLRSVRAAWVAVLGWPVVAALSAHEPGQWYLEALAVHPDYRDVGVGTVLVADAFERARRDGCTELALDADSHNTRAIALYERLGLSVVKTSRQASLLGGVRIKRMVAPVPVR